MLKRLITLLLFVVAAALGLAGCTTLEVRSDVNTALFHPGQCHSFGWAGRFEDKSALRDSVANPVNEARLRAAITAHMQSIGVQFTTSNPDCLVGYGIGSHTVVEGGYPYDWAWGWGWGGGWGGWGPWGMDMPYVYHQGSIDVDLYEAKSHEPLWHASVDQSLYGATGADAEKRINAAVDAIFSKFPT
ncbi:MAG TPA: DUF4136 domain-containing protein [Steroidobacteraceae bacterium]|nr:DUF4136 domain-containing protein [Steroidobacteraceae bacterium]